MSMQFGVWKFDGGPMDEELIQAADTMLADFGPDGSSRYQNQGLVLTYHALHTTAESRRDSQPYVSRRGMVMAWDGRLDSREDLIRQLSGDVDAQISDVAIVALAFDRWGNDCFPMLLGDWALSIWNPQNRTLILAKDALGVRPLYYQAVEGKEVRWSSALDPLVTLSGRQFELDLSYVAGWLYMYPAADKTAFVGIQAVPPCSFVTLSSGGCRVHKYWDFNPEKQIRYRTDGEYEEHFREVFGTAVRRRLRSDRTICAELSGGMDSPSVVCMADRIYADSAGAFADLETVSYYDESEPNANELPYISKVEEQRGKVGFHFSTTHERKLRLDDSGSFEAVPAEPLHAIAGKLSPYAQFLDSKQIRVVLSGQGGDEVMGGVPTPVCELQDLITQFQFGRLAHQLKMWALHKRVPWFFLFGDAVKGFLPSLLAPKEKHGPLGWLNKEFVQHQKIALGELRKRVRWGVLPCFQANLSALETLRCQLATHCGLTRPPHEKRFPFLDRDLLEFMFAIPREQVLRPGYRRSLMRRAMAGMVPSEVLQNRRKAFVSRAPRVAISTEWEPLVSFTDNMAACRLGVVDQAAFRGALLRVQSSDKVSLFAVMRTIEVETWLRNILRRGVIRDNYRDSTKIVTCGVTGSQPRIA